MSSPSPLTIFGSASLSKNNLTFSISPREAALINTVSPSPSMISRLAPSFNNNFITSLWACDFSPYEIAYINGVLPDSSMIFISAPLPNNDLTVSISPSSHALRISFTKPSASDIYINTYIIFASYIFWSFKIFWSLRFSGSLAHVAPAWFVT